MKDKDNVIQLYPSHGKSTDDDKKEIKLVGELFIFDLHFQLGILVDGKFALGLLCECGKVHEVQDDENFKVSMAAATHTPAEFLAAMMPLVSALVKERMSDLDMIK